MSEGQERIKDLMVGFTYFHTTFSSAMGEIASQDLDDPEKVLKIIDDACEALKGMAHKIVELRVAGYRAPITEVRPPSHKAKMKRLAEEQAALKNELLRAEIAKATGQDDEHEDDGFIEALRGAAALVWADEG